MKKELLFVHKKQQLLEWLGGGGTKKRVKIFFELKQKKQEGAQFSIVIQMLFFKCQHNKNSNPQGTLKTCCLSA